MFTVAFFKAAGERAVRSAAFAFLGTVGVGAVSIGDVDWLKSLSVAAVAAILSFITSISVNSATGTGPSVTSAEQTVARDEVVVAAG